MKVIQSYCIAKLHELAVNYVMNHGYEIITEDNEHTIECEPLTLVCKTPLDYPTHSFKSSLKHKMLKDYADKLTKGYSKDTVFEYDYHSRLTRYDFDFGRMGGDNQLRYVIDKLRKYPTSRRAQAITWIPKIDMRAKDVPCLQYIQFTIRDNKLNMAVMFRSNDMLLALGANMFGLTELMKDIAYMLNIDVGTYTHISLIPHIYDKRDADELERFMS